MKYPEVERAISSAIGNANDNLHRAKMQRRSDPNWMSGNGETIDQIIAQYESHRNKLVDEALELGIEI